MRILGVALLATMLVGCASVDQAAETFNQANLCIDALQAAEFAPDNNNPDLTVENAQPSARELSDLAAQAQDVTVRDAINALQAQVTEVVNAGGRLDDLQAWLQQKADLYQQLGNACA